MQNHTKTLLTILSIFSVGGTGFSHNHEEPLASSYDQGAAGEVLMGEGGATEMLEVGEGEAQGSVLEVPAEGDVEEATLIWDEESQAPWVDGEEAGDIGVEAEAEAKTGEGDSVAGDSQNTEGASEVSSEDEAKLTQESDAVLDGEWITVELPAIGGSIKVPSQWYQPTSEQVLKATEYIDYPSEEAKVHAEMGALAVGRMSFLVTKNPEPTPDLNPGVSITWERIPASFDQLPLEARSEGLAQVLAASILPALKQRDKGFQLLEGPKVINHEGGGAWATFRVSSTLKTGGVNNGVARLYLIPGRDHIIAAAIVTPAERDEAEEVLPELWAIFESLTYAR